MSDFRYGSQLHLATTIPIPFVRLQKHITQGLANATNSQARQEMLDVAFNVA